MVARSNSLIDQLNRRNLTLSFEPILFHLKYLVQYYAIPLFLALLGLRGRFRFEIIGLIFLGFLMIWIVSLRLPGYYNGILFVPFFILAGGLSVASLLASNRKKIVTICLIPLVAFYVLVNVKLYYSQLSDVRAICLQNNSLATAHYFPDTINLKYSIYTPSIEYSAHYFRVITDFYYWPTITKKIEADPNFVLLLEGKLKTCRD